MARPRSPGWNAVLPVAAWLLLLALLPYWLGLSLLLALVAMAALLQHRLAAAHAALIRRALRWGLPGVLFALQRALGGNLFAWGAALLGALAGYTLLAGLDAWLDRGARPTRPSSPADAGDSWPELAMAPIGPVAHIIELQPPTWQPAAEHFVDPRLGSANYRDGCYRFADGREIGKAGPHAGFSPAGRWFVARLERDRGLLLWDRERDQRIVLRGWQLCGWHAEQPWLSRREGDMPLALRAVLSEDDPD
jgi:hypothetical protein